MAGDIYRMPLPGSPLNIPAKLQAKVIDNAHGNKLDTTEDVAQHFRQATVVYVRNDSGVAKDQFNIMGLNGPAITPTQKLDEFKRRVCFAVIAPTLASHSHSFCVLLDPLKIGGMGRAVVGGVVQTKVTGALSTKWAAVTNSDATKLTMSAAGGCRVLWSDSGSGERWAIVRLGEWNPKVKGRLDGSLAKDGSQTMSVWQSGADTTENLTVYDHLLATGQTIASGKDVTAYWDTDDGKWYVDAGECA